MLIFVSLPLPASNMIIRVHYSGIVDSNYAIYYSDNENSFQSDKYIMGEINNKKNYISFRLPDSVKNLTELRMDFPDTDELLCIHKITISSAGIIQKQYDPNIFFAPENIISTNHIDAISLVSFQDKTYLATDGYDPYIVFSSNLVQDINSGFSQYRLTRIFICLFIIVCYLFYKNNPFKSK